MPCCSRAIRDSGHLCQARPTAPGKASVEDRPGDRPADGSLQSGYKQALPRPSRAWSSKQAGGHARGLALSWGRDPQKEGRSPVLPVTTAFPASHAVGCSRPPWENPLGTAVRRQRNCQPRQTSQWEIWSTILFRGYRGTPPLLSSLNDFSKGNGFVHISCPPPALPSLPGCMPGTHSRRRM